MFVGLDTRGGEGMDEQKQIMAAARGDNKNNEINGIKVNFVFGKQMGDNL